jgi:hypothetical protein
LSSKTKAKEFAPGGTFSILTGGFTLEPSHPYFEGMVLSFPKAGLLTLIFIPLPDSWPETTDREKTAENSIIPMKKKMLLTLSSSGSIFCIIPGRRPVFNFNSDIRMNKLEE